MNGLENLAEELGRRFVLLREPSSEGDGRNHRRHPRSKGKKRKALARTNAGDTIIRNPSHLCED
jgi:hypothetical protein